MLCGELLAVVKKPTTLSRDASVTRYGAVRGFLDECFKVLSVVGCVVVFGCIDVARYEMKCYKIETQCPTQCNFSNT